jgi:hypothetical protein
MHAGTWPARVSALLILLDPAVPGWFAIPGSGSTHSDGLVVVDKISIPISHAPPRISLVHERIRSRIAGCAWLVNADLSGHTSAVGRGAAFLLATWVLYALTHAVRVNRGRMPAARNFSTSSRSIKILDLIPAGL